MGEPSGLRDVKMTKGDSRTRVNLANLEAQLNDGTPVRRETHRRLRQAW